MSGKEHGPGVNPVYSREVTARTERRHRAAKIVGCGAVGLAVLFAGSVVGSSMLVNGHPYGPFKKAARAECRAVDPAAVARTTEAFARYGDASFTAPLRALPMYELQARDRHPPAAAAAFQEVQELTDFTWTPVEDVRQARQNIQNATSKQEVVTAINDYTTSQVDLRVRLPRKGEEWDGGVAKNTLDVAEMQQQAHGILNYYSFRPHEVTEVIEPHRREIVLANDSREKEIADPQASQTSITIGQVVNKTIYLRDASWLGHEEAHIYQREFCKQDPNEEVVDRHFTAHNPPGFRYEGEAWADDPITNEQRKVVGDDSYSLTNATEDAMNAQSLAAGNLFLSAHQPYQDKQLYTVAQLEQLVPGVSTFLAPVTTIGLPGN